MQSRVQNVAQIIKIVQIMQAAQVIAFKMLRLGLYSHRYYFAPAL